MKEIQISERLVKKDGMCCICEYKEKETGKRFGYTYTGTFVDEIVKGKHGLTSGYYAYPNYKNIQRIVYKDLETALNEIAKGTYNKFEKVYIRKLNRDVTPLDIYKD